MKGNSYKGTLITSPFKSVLTLFITAYNRKISEPGAHEITLSKREQRPRTVGLWVSRKE